MATTLDPLGPLVSNTKRSSYGTPFSQWVRNEPGLDSQTYKLSATNIDFLWEGPNDKGYWMLIEEKQHGAKVKEWQLIAFRKLHRVIKDETHYKGFHILQFENTAPSDGRTWLDGQEVPKVQVIIFLRFGKFYPTTFLQR